jgi:hypothetical protein
MFHRAVVVGNHFALTRYGNGEAALLQGRELLINSSNRNWCWRPSQGFGDTVFIEELNDAFDFENPLYHIGISCPCCNRADYAYYVKRLSAREVAARVTYANLFSNGNWKYLKEWIVDALTAAGRTVMLVTHWDKNFDLARSFLPRTAVEIVPVGDIQFDQSRQNLRARRRQCGGAVQWYCENRVDVQQRFRALAASTCDAIFLVQVGPVSNVLIHQMFKINPRNIYLDMGHSLDGILFGDPSRSFQRGLESPMCADMDVSWDPLNPQ